ncbi:MAG: PQQ-dependent sugar dehydrogenase [Caldilineaceae bacterium]|nr:PQQ-dependent sugar dehydrogenase [Caldilineaceae bacterium]
MNTQSLTRRLPRTVLSLTLVAFLFAGVLPARAEMRAAGLELPAGFYVRATVDGLAAPTDLAALPDGRLLVTEKGAGRDAAAVAAVRLVADGAVREEAVLTLSVNAAGDSGLLAIALDAAFAANGYFYLYYATGEDALDWRGATVNRLSRFTFDAATGRADPASELVLIDDIPWSTQHNGGGLTVDGDGLLYLAVGDTLDSAAVADLGAFNGKVLRVQPTASGYRVPPANPFVDVDGARPEVFALGLRSPFRAVTHPTDGAVYVADVGAAAWEEVNALAPGADFGWPVREGPCPNGYGLPCPPAPAQYTDPAIYYPHPAADDGVPTGSSLTGLAVYGGDALPAAYRGGFFMADLNLGTITVATRTVDGFSLAPFAANIPGVVALAFVDDELYVVDIFAGTITVISHADVQNRIPVMQFDATPQLGPAPLTVHLDASGSYDPDDDAFVYVWDLGDGAPAYISSTPVVTHTYTSDANYVVQLQGLDVDGGLSEPVQRTVTVYSGEVPQIELTNLTEPGRTAYHGGDLWGYAATRATGVADLDPDAPYTWDIYLHHNQHAHPILQSNVTISDTLAIDTDNHGGEWNLWYRLALTMKTATGQTVTVDRILDPAFVNLTVASEPPGQTLQLNNTVVNARTRLKTIVGTVHTLAAPPQVVLPDGVGVFDHWYVFADGWPLHAADGGTIMTTPAITVTAPLTDTTYTAYYRFDRPANNVYLPHTAR